MHPERDSAIINHPNPGPRASLSRSDWRFLLPGAPSGSFQHLILLGGPAGLGERLVEVGFARRVSDELQEGRCADCVVVLHEARVALSEAAGCLISGGVLYYEVDRRSASRLALTPKRVHRLLRALALTLTGAYWVVPNFTQCKRYLPLDVPAALRWYLTTLFPAMTPLDRLFEICIRTLIGFNSRRLAPFVPCYSVTAIAGPAQDVAPSVLGLPGLPGELQRPGLRPFLLTSGYDDGSRVVMLPFTPESVQPVAVLKISRLDAFNINTEREQETLHTVRARLDATMRQTIPRPLGVLRYGALTVGVESCAAGHSLVVSSGRWGAPAQRKLDDLRLGARWLGEFHRQTQIKRLPWNEQAIRTWIEAPLAAFTHAFGTRAHEDRLFTMLRAHARALTGSSLLIVWQHNDFGPWNLYRADQKLQVIDWEFGHDRDRHRFGPALCDLLYFVTTWSVIAHRLRTRTAQLRAFRRLFFEPEGAGVSAKVIHHVMAEYMASLAIDQHFFPLLLVYTWVERALDRFTRQRISAKEVVEARVGNRFVDYIGVIAEHSDRLFTMVAREPCAGGKRSC